MTSQKIAIGLVVVTLFVGSVTAYAAEFDVGVKAYQRGDYATAIQIFRQFADRGNAIAQNNLGLIYDYGKGVAQDYAEAAKWYRKAADQGYVRAQSNLGVMYDKGWGVAQDYGEALRWYRKAADQGYALAQDNLGTMYHFGTGVTRDYVQAHMWFTLAVAKGEILARKLRDSLAKQMTPAQIAVAQKLARKWKPKGK